MTAAQLRPLTAAHIVGGTGTYFGTEAVTVAGGEGIEAGTILGKVTATGVYARHAPGASDGTQTVAGVLFERVVGTDVRTVHVRDTELVKGNLIYSAAATGGQITAADTALRALGLIPRV